MKENTFYKIRHKRNGHWSKGGSYVPGDGSGSLWVAKGGKTWDTLGKLRAHITTHMNQYHGGTDMSEWEVVEFKCAPTDIKMVHEIVDPKKLVELLKR